MNRNQSAVAQKKHTWRQVTLSVRKNYNKRTKDLIPLKDGQPVYYQYLEGQQLRKGTAQSRKDEQPFIMEGDSGGVYQRNRVHIRQTCFQNALELDTPQNQTNETWLQTPDVPKGSEKSEDATPAASSFFFFFKFT